MRVDVPAGATRARDHREREIAEVRGQYGLSYLAHVVGIDRLAGFDDGVAEHGPAATHTPPEKLRLALEELGPTFIKLGQVLSTRTDLLSPDYVSELAKLQDWTPALSSEVVAEIVERELRAPATAVFATFESQLTVFANDG